MFFYASKGQKFLNYTDSEKFEIIQRYKNGESGYQLAKEYGIPIGTIKMRKYKIEHPEKINNDFDNNYDMIKIIFTTDDINTIKVMIKSLILKNIYFFKID